MMQGEKGGGLGIFFTGGSRRNRRGPSAYIFSLRRAILLPLFFSPFSSSDWEKYGENKIYIF